MRNSGRALPHCHRNTVLQKKKGIVAMAVECWALVHCEGERIASLSTAHVQGQFLYASNNGRGQKSSIFVG